ncbi:probable LRR receptor-like serine/threonine-protein kinase At3g47570 isoform X3 [Capsicum annuum]|uniref:probable LRR receptor-like serine/threonine-protein kinase At3g47570 isoform X3 n=1 Tax=Capsicum annuum TaxID=4072 RepID=UPI001FB0BDEB|nr:probable LRR receptor-like serine/threonine-protein kinase At3g47570 isoform X3 [Capsicum annuum]
MSTLDFTGYLPNGLCNGLPILKGLYLSRNKLHGHISTSLSDCSQLQELFLSENDFIGEIPKEISNLIELEVLNIEINRFSVPLPMEIFNISGLRIIGISFNNLSGILPPNMGSILPNIEKFGLDGLVSTKCDVYSYGIMLLETFTRRKPNEFEGNLSLKQWVSYSLPDAVMDVADANLLTSTGNRFKKELDVEASIIKVGSDCCNESPARRTNMKDVVGMLQKIKNLLLPC